MQLNRRDLLLAAAVAGCSPVAGRAQPEAATADAGPLLTRRIGSTAESLPIVGLGTWQAFDIPNGGPEWVEAREAVRVFAARGGQVVDSSPMYGKAEDALGAIVADLKVRPKLFVATKVWTEGQAAGVAQMEASSGKLAAPVVDLMQVHNLLDVDTHMPTLRAWKEAGRIRYIGLTHYADSGYEAAARRHPVDFIQINLSAVERGAEARLLPFARERGLGVLINRPFAAGNVFSRVRQLPLPGWASEIGAGSWAQVLLKYVLANPAVTCAIPGTRNPRYVADNLGAATGPLPDEAMRRRIVEAVLAA